MNFYQGTYNSGAKIARLGSFVWKPRPYYDSVENQSDKSPQPTWRKSDSSSSLSVAKDQRCEI